MSDQFHLSAVMADAIIDHPMFAELTTGWSRPQAGALALQLATRALRATRGGGGNLHPWANHLPTFERAYQRANEKHGHYESIMAGLNAMIEEATPR